MHSRKFEVSDNNDAANLDPLDEDIAFKTFVLVCIRIDDLMIKRLTTIDLKYGLTGPLICSYFIFNTSKLNIHTLFKAKFHNKNKIVNKI